MDNSSLASVYFHLEHKKTFKGRRGVEFDDAFFFYQTQHLVFTRADVICHIFINIIGFVHIDLHCKNILKVVTWMSTKAVSFRLNKHLHTFYLVNIQPHVSKPHTEKCAKLKTCVHLAHIFHSDLLWHPVVKLCASGFSEFFQ